MTDFPLSLTSPNQRPNKDWLKFVKSSSAKAKIRHYMRAEQRSRSKALGRELLEREMRKHDLSYNKVEKSGDLVHAAAQLRVQSVDDLLHPHAARGLDQDHVALPHHSRQGYGGRLRIRMFRNSIGLHARLARTKSSQALSFRSSATMGFGGV